MDRWIAKKSNKTKPVDIDIDTALAYGLRLTADGCGQCGSHTVEWHTSIINQAVEPEPRLDRPSRRVGLPSSHVARV